MSIEKNKIPNKQAKKLINKIIDKYRKKDETRKEFLTRSFYELRSVLGNDWAIFYCLLGGRDTGKSYAVAQFFVDQFINKGRPFYWLRLTPASANQLLMNNAEKLIDAEIKRRYKLDLHVIGNHVYNVTKRDKDGKIKEKKLMCTVLAIASFYNDKGSAYYDFKFLNDPDMYYNICLDEMNREKNERKTFDICYALINQIENLVRETNYKIRLIMIGNTLDQASDIMCLFNFIPEDFGRYYLVRNKKKLIEYLKEMKNAKTTKEKQAVKEKYKDCNFGKRCVVEYIPLSDKYITRRKGSIADILLPNASTFSNKIKCDTALISKERPLKPKTIIKFTKEQEDWFTVWNDKLVRMYNKEQLKNIVAMRKYEDEVFIPELQKNVFDLFDLRSFKFDSLMTFKRFQKNLEVIKPQK